MCYTIIIMKNLDFPKFNCVYCNIKTNNKKDYTNHLLTAKHKNVTILHQNVTILPQNVTIIKQYNCICNKIYNNRTSLWRHKQKCIDIISATNKHITNDNKTKIITEPENIKMTLEHPSDSDEQSWTIDPSSNEIRLNENMMYKLFKEMMESNHESTKELITSIAESNQASNNELKQIILEQQSQILELARKPTVNNTQINKTKNVITVNMFLIDHCKEAMTLNTFIKSIKPSPEQIMYMTNKGNREGLIQIMNHTLCSMNITERPIHFTDIKRNTTWVKKDDGWIKEHDLASMNRLCKNINRSCTVKIMEIIDEDKEYSIPRSDKHELFLKMVMEANGGAGLKEDSNALAAINIIKDRIYLGSNNIVKAVL